MENVETRWRVFNSQYELGEIWSRDPVLQIAYYSMSTSQPEYQVFGGGGGGDKKEGKEENFPLFLHSPPPLLFPLPEGGPDVQVSTSQMCRLQVLNGLHCILRLFHWDPLVLPNTHSYSPPARP